MDSSGGSGNGSWAEAAVAGAVLAFMFFMMYLLSCVR